MGSSEQGIPVGLVTVLVVDDVQIARRIASRMLSEAGFRVLEADGAGEAIEVLGQARGRVDLVLLDIVMEERDGIALAHRIREEWPDQRVLFMSAYPAQVMVQYGAADPAMLFLAKPFTSAELWSKVREALGRSVSEQRLPRQLR